MNLKANTQFKDLLKLVNRFLCLLKGFLLCILFISCAVNERKTSNMLSIKDSTLKKDINFNLILKNNKVALIAKNNSLIEIEVNFVNRINDSIINNIITYPNDSIIIHSWNSNERDKIYKKFKENYRIAYYYGNSKTIVPDTNFLYRLPFKKGKKYRVSQSFNGKYSHNSIHSKYAIDFSMSIGDPVFAARSGVVIKIKDHFKDHGGRKFIKKANLIMILHDDGTYASYVHLDYKGVLVNEGEYVIRGQKIGYSGFTGYTRGPHLHFVVRKGKDISIPIAFEGYKDEVLLKNKKYKVNN